MEVGEGQLLAVAQFRDLLDGVVGFFFLHSGIAAQIESLRRKREAAAGVFHHIHHAQQQIFADGGEFVEVPRQDVGQNFHVRELPAMSMRRTRTVLVSTLGWL